MKQLIVLGALLFAVNAAADCPSSVPAKTPEIPDGVIASEQLMRDAMVDIRTYVHTIETYLDCSDFILSARRHDELVHKARDVANAYNRELLRFQRRDEVVAQN